MSSPMETPAPESPGIFAEGDLKVLIVYFLAFGIWTAAAGNDFISATWRSVRRTRQRGKLHVALVFFPTIVIVAYVVFQRKTLDYKEMGAALLAFAFAVLHLSRTFMGLWQLYTFKQWAISSIKSMESLGYIVDENSEENYSDEADEGLRQCAVWGLKWAWKQVVPHREPDRIERIADTIRVNETLVDNRLSDVHTVCNFRFLSREQSEIVKCRNPWFKRLCLRYWFRVLNAPRVFQVLFSLIFFETPQMLNSSSGPRLDPRHPESVWLKWATALVAHAGWKLQGTMYMDLNSAAGYTEHRNQFAEQVLLSASLHTRRMAEAGVSTPCNVEEGSMMSGFLPFPDWHKYPELCKGKFSKQEWLKQACTTGSGLPYRMKHRKAKEMEDRWGYGNFKSEMRRAREALPPELETRLEDFDVAMLEWFTIFVSVKDWASGSPSRAHSWDAECNPEGHDWTSEGSSRAHSGDDERNPEGEPENDIPVENLKKQLGYTKEDSFNEGRSRFPLLQSVPSAILWDNRNVLEISCHIDNWIALCAGEQTSYMLERIPWMKQKLSLENAFRKSSTISSSGDGYSSIEQVVGECASFEKYRFLCQMALIQPEHYHLDQSLTFLGCSMEMLRSSLAEWVESHQSTEQACWKPALFSNESAPEGKKRKGLSPFQSSDDFISCLRSLESVEHMSTGFVKMRVLWELQSHCHTRLREKGAAPGSLEAIALCILSFPALSMEVRDRVLTLVDGRNESSVDVGEYDGDQFRIENHEYVIQSSCGPQDLRLILSFKAVTEKSELLCKIEGIDVDYFDWEAWRNAFYGRLEACRLWKEKTGILNFALIAPSHPLNIGVQKVPCSTAPSIPESGTGAEIWKGWLPHCASICKYEIASKGFILESRESEGVRIPVSMDEGISYNFTVPQEIWVHVNYADASTASLKNASILAHDLLSSNLWCQRQENAPSVEDRIEALLNQDCNAVSSSELRFLEVASIQERDTKALEKVIHALLRNGKNREAITRGVTLLERFYFFDSHGTSNLYSFCSDEKYVETVISLFELIFESSDCDKYVAERFQLFLILLMRYRPKEVSDNALSVIFRSMVRKCYSAEVVQSTESVVLLCRVLPFGSSLEEFAVLVSAHANVTNCPMTSRKRSASQQVEVTVQLCLAIPDVAELVGGIDALEELGFSPNRTVEFLNRCIAECGDFDVMNRLAMILANGAVGIEKDVGRAAELYTLAINEGKNSNAMHNFAVLLLEGGEGLDRDFPRAVELLNRSITEGDNFHAMNRLAMVLENGVDGVEKDVGRAVELYTFAIDEGKHTWAMENFAELLMKGGEGVDRDVPRAIELFNRSIAEGENFYAMNRLAIVLENGVDGVEKDVGRAVELYTRAIDEGKNTWAMENFAELLIRGGKGVDRDVPRAVELLNRSITEGHNFHAMNCLAIILENGAVGVEKDVGRAVELYTCAIDEGNHTSAMYSFAVLLLKGGEGSDRDVPRAVELLNLSITEGGNFDAMNRLAIILENGDNGVDKDIPRCVSLYSRAVNEGKHEKAMYNLGVLLCGNKEGVEPDIVHAACLFNRCIDGSGNVDAMVKYAELLQTGWDGASADIPHALNLYKRAVNEGQSVDAMHKLAVLLESESEGIEKNIPHAVRLYSRAVDEGKNPVSMVSLGRLLEAGGEGVAKNPGRVLELYSTAVGEHGSTEAMERLASALHSGGDGIEKDAERAVALYTRAIAEGGSTVAMGALAQILEVGDDGVPADPERAAALYERSARES